MSYSNFNIGDRVRIVRDFCGFHVCGKTGTIIEDFPFTLSPDKGRYVRLDTPMGEPDPGRDLVWCFFDAMQLIQKKHPVIVITTDGKTTTATMREGKKVLKTATASCNDSDTFSFDEGARIAFERLQGRDPFQAEGLFTGKVVCIKSKVPRFWTVGKIYEIKGGKVKDNSGAVLTTIRTLDEMNRRLKNWVYVIPLVEG